MPREYSLEAIADAIGAKLVRKGASVDDIVGFNNLLNASVHEMSFVSDERYEAQLPQTRAGAVIIQEKLLDQCPVNALVMENPYLGFAKAAQLFDQTPKPELGIHSTAVVDSSASLGKDLCIGPYVVIGKEVSLGDHVVVEAGAVINDGTKIGDHTVIRANAVIGHAVVIGAHSIIHQGAVIGSDGFGLANDNGKWVKISQLGSVVIGDYVEVGANTTIDRGAINNTIIEDGVRIDNQVQIAHNVKVGADTAMAAQVGIAGSTVIGKHCLLAGNVGISGHIEIADGVTVTAKSGVSGSLTEPGVYGAGIPVRPVGEWRRNTARILRLDKLMERVKVLEMRLAELEQ